MLLLTSGHHNLIIGLDYNNIGSLGNSDIVSKVVTQNQVFYLRSIAGFNAPTCMKTGILIYDHLSIDCNPNSATFTPMYCAAVAPGVRGGAPAGTIITQPVAETVAIQISFGVPTLPATTTVDIDWFNTLLVSAKPHQSVPIVARLFSNGDTRTTMCTGPGGSPNVVAPAAIAAELNVNVRQGFNDAEIFFYADEANYPRFPYMRPGQARFIDSHGVVDLTSANSWASHEARTFGYVRSPQMVLLDAYWTSMTFQDHNKGYSQLVGFRDGDHTTICSVVVIGAMSDGDTLTFRCMHCDGGGSNTGINTKHAWVHHIDVSTTPPHRFAFRNFG